MTDKRIYKYKNIKNIRDFGGLKTKDGKVISSNKLIRSGNLGLATPEELDGLKNEHGLKKIIDLRTSVEISENPDKLSEDIDLQNIPVFTESTLGVTHENVTDRRQMLEMLPELPTLYSLMFTNEDSLNALKSIVHTIVENRDGSIMWHCTEGKDRCGVVSSLILSILDVDEKTIYEDYMYTNKTAMPKGNKYFWLVLMAYRSLKNAKKVKGLYIVKPEYLKAAFDTINEKYGGMDEFIKNKLGITDEMKQSFKEYMTE